MTQRDALLRAVCDTPDDDLPRLVFADWCEEHGDQSDQDRALFIRLQCRHAKLDPETDEADRLWERADELLAGRYEEWTAELPAHPAYQWSFFHRGFIPRLHVDEFVPSFAADLERMFARTPLVHLTFGEPHAAAVFVRSPHFARIRLVYLNGRVSRDLIAALAAADVPPHLWGITVVRGEDVPLADREALRAKWGERMRV